MVSTYTPKALPINFIATNICGYGRYAPICIPATQGRHSGHLLIFSGRIQRRKMEPYSVAIRPGGPVLVDFSARSADFSTHIQWHPRDTRQLNIHIQWSTSPVTCNITFFSVVCMVNTNFVTIFLIKFIRIIFVYQHRCTISEDPVWRSRTATFYLKLSCVPYPG